MRCLALDEAQGQGAWALVSNVAVPYAIYSIGVALHAASELANQADEEAPRLLEEEDIIEALEEMIEALQKAQEQMEQEQQDGPSGPSPPPGDKPLVDELAELKMIRSLQFRVNKRTKRYSRLLDDADDPAGQAMTEDLIEALEGLGTREQKIYRIMRDINLGKNK